ncbi:MAG: type VI secretion system ATPase TssH, partial [Rikenellaceae bacterium]|nr:type VI secretion system ATPase TssH [Rikenellaceae bacterium]
MNINTLTIKAQEALQSAFALAASRNNQAVEPVHILSAIIADEGSVASFVLTRVGANLKALRQNVDTEIGRLPQVSGGEQYFAPESSKVIQRAVDFTKNFGDKYASVEHLLLGLLADGKEASRLLKDAGATEKELLAAIRELRKGGTIDSQTAEQTFDALGKYAIHLNEMARSGKLDPVIGRDE